MKRTDGITDKARTEHDTRVPMGSVPSSTLYYCCRAFMPE